MSIDTFTCVFSIPQVNVSFFVAFQLFLAIEFRPKVSAEIRHFSPKVSVSAESQIPTFGRTLLNVFFCSHSIPFWDKCKFVGSTTKRLFAHYLDMARDLILNVTLSGLIAGRAFIFQWVSNQFILHLTCKVHHIM